MNHIRRRTLLLIALSRIFFPLWISSVSGEAFELFGPKRILRRFSGTFRKGMFATTIAETGGVVAPSNWRVVPAQSDDYGSHLVQRTRWSEEQFQDSLKLYERFMECSDSYLSSGIKTALNTLDHAYRLYGPESVICSFNGGKDAVVILHLVRAAHAKYYNDTASESTVRPRVVYFNHADEFPEVLEFLQQSVQDYDLDMIAFEKGVKFADGLRILVNHNIPPGCNATFPMSFVLGTRSSDPNAVGQDHFSPSSHWMPPFMRANPILDWNYGHVWHFLRLFELPYCSLYDQGYTSLGTTKDTLPCPALAVNTGSSTESSVPKFWPAYMLRDWDQERAGRIKKEKTPSASSKATKTEKSSMEPTPQPSALPIRTPESVSGMSIGGQLESRSAVVEISSEQNLASNESATRDDDSSVFSLGCDNGMTVQKSVGLLVIGDEILKGMTKDQNTNAAAKALRNRCVKLSRVVVVSDDQEEIVKDIHRLQEEVDVIITSGGVGPTHDDVTIKSVAASMECEMVFHDEMAELLKSKMNNATDDPLTPAQIKMAALPSNAKLRYLSDVEGDWPILQCRNIFVLPGVPEFFSKKIENVAHYLSTQLERSTAYKVVLRIDEASIVEVLNEAVEEHPNVTFGSYPFVSHPEYKTVLTLEGSLVRNEGSGQLDNADPKVPLRARNSTFFGTTKASILPKEERDQYVRSALDDLLQRLPKDSILRVENDDVGPFS